MDSRFRNTQEHRNAAGITAGLSVVLIILVVLLQPDLFSHKIIAVGAVVAIIIAVTLFRVLDLFKINNYPAIFLGIYNLLLVFAQVYILAPFHPVSFLWLLLQIRTHSYLGSRWAIFWWFAFSISSFAGLYFANDPTQEQAYFVVFQVTIALILSFALEDSLRQQEGFQKDRDDQVAEANRLQKRLESMFNNVHIAIFGIDIEGKIVVYNHAALDIINQNAELHGLHIDDVLGLSDDNGDLLRIENLMKQESAIDRQDVYLHLGVIERMPVNLIIRKFSQSYSEKDRIHFVLTLRDLTKERKLDKGQSDFISMVSHELRTPITIAEGQVSNAMLIGKKEGMVPAMESSLDTAHEQILFLAEMINEVSTISQAERDEIDKLKLERIEPKKIIERVVADHTSESESQEIALNIEVDEEVDSIITSKSYVIDILNNLVENALKYTEKGSVTVGVVPEDGRVRFYVKDTGIGISHSDGKSVFNKFFRAADVKTQEHNGTGLGLYLSQQLARRINAWIDFESTVGVGSEFSLHIPRIGALKRDAKEVRKTEVNEFMSEV